MKRSSERRKSVDYIQVGHRVWRHPSVIALVESYGRGADPIMVIRERARNLVAEARKFGWRGPPFDPRALASLRGIRLSPDRLSPQHDALIIPSRGQQLEIVFNETRPITRQNFSICHEVCHTLFPDGYEMIRHRYQRRDAFDSDRELEQLCDIGAAELLLPEDEFRADLDRFGLTLAAVAPFRQRYEASREAVIRRLVQLGRTPIAAAFLEHRLKPSEEDAAHQLSLIRPAHAPQPKFRIAYTVVSDTFPVFLPRHKSVPDTSCVYRAVSQHSFATGTETWNIAGLPPCRVEATPMPSGDDGETLRAVALLKP